MAEVRIATAGWSAPRTDASFPQTGSVLERYAAVFDAVEINTSFYRPHRRSTYERWALSTPTDFRFSVKAPRTITHERRLAQVEEPLIRFVEEVNGLGAKLGALLLQTPPSLAFEPQAANTFFSVWRKVFDTPTALEPRHATWFTPQADVLLRAWRIGRVAADPALTPTAARPGGDLDFVYRRLHGAPQTYVSAYNADALRRLASELLQAGGWCVFDNTKFGAATANGIALKRLLVDL